VDLSDSSLFAALESALGSALAAVSEVSGLVESTVPSVASAEGEADGEAEDEAEGEADGEADGEGLDDSDGSTELGVADGESSATPVSTSTEAESLLSPERGPQVGQATSPRPSRIFSATAICCERLAWSALGAYSRPP